MSTHRPIIFDPTLFGINFHRSFVYNPIHVSNYEMFADNLLFIVSISVLQTIYEPIQYGMDLIGFLFNWD